VADIFSTLDDEKSLRLFKALGIKAGSSEDFTYRLKLSHKEYYSRMSRFVRIGIVKRKNRKYYLTALGIVVHDSEEIVSRAVNNLWKLKAIDSIDLSNGITTHERKRLLESLVDDTDIRQILSSRFSPR
jgi:predicted transcriptional regulator